MAWSGPSATPATVRIATVLPALTSSERRVVDLVARDPDAVVDGTAQDLAHRAGVARSTVVRACQSLGYPGYPQLRVALARELDAAPTPSHGELGRLATAAEAAAAGIRALSSVVTDEQIEQAVEAVASAGRVLVVGSAFSVPLAVETALRLTVAGRPAESVTDGFAQRVAAAQLRPGDLCVVVSASGSDPDGIAAGRAAHSAGAGVLALTSFPRSPLATWADTVLVAPPVPGPLVSQQDQTSHLGHALLAEVLVDAVHRRRARG